ncbi:MAG: SEC-C metal-binding domain-containing protein [Actinomycetota bacterium]
MGRGLAILVHHELASLITEDFEHEGALLSERARQLNQREQAVAKREADLEQREKWLVTRERRAYIGGRTEDDLKRVSAPARKSVAVPRAGRNDPCLCGSGLKYKRCHGA